MTIESRNNGQKIITPVNKAGGETLNWNFAWLDALQGGVSDRTGTTPASPAEGDLYILTGTVSGVWATDSASANDLALYYNSQWNYITPPSGKAGLRLWVQDESNIYTWNGSAWTGNVDGGLDNIAQDENPTLGGNLDTSTFKVGAASAADLTKLSEVTASSAELNFADGVTSSIQTQFSG